MLRSISKALVLAMLVALPASAQYFEEGLAAYNRGDYEPALNDLRPLALKGEARAQHYLAFMYLRGKGVPQSDAEAATWFRKAAKQGHINAQYNLAVMYHIGLGVQQNDSEAVKWFRMAAKQGHGEALQNLNFMRTKGRRLASPAPARQDLGSLSSAIKSMRKMGQRVVTKAPPAITPEKTRTHMAPVKPTREKNQQAATKAKAPPETAPGDFKVRLGAVKSRRELDQRVVTKAVPTPVRNAFHIQLGAVKLKASAEKEAGRLNRAHKLVLGGLTIVPIRSDLGKRGIFYRLRAGPLNGWSTAKSLCRKLSARKQSCIVANP